MRSKVATKKWRTLTCHMRNIIRNPFVVLISIISYRIVCLIGRFVTGIGSLLLDKFFKADLSM